ncbi:tetratricopeptide repeat protein [Nostoc spongiaeforme FACHB-130]|uniref:Tetratricopeptide repeat protein n=2 Tax=Nostoc TaxID=1177 RepID=A0ABR8FS01_9NOSO|nr:tetratricopeptide repeat protein [Nostoc spongiaeforme FACHB-130]
MVAGGMTTGLVLSMLVPGIAQQQPPKYSAQQQAALKEAGELNKQVLKLYQEGKYSTAIPLAERALAIREKVLGNVHPDVATSLNNLAGLYEKQGKYQQAEPFYLRALAIRGKVLGNVHPDVATSLNNLAFLFQAQGKYQQAEPLYLRSLAIREKVLGKEHLDVATSLNNLALLYDTQGKYQQAEPLYLRSLAIFEKVLGNSHPSVATSLNNLALLYNSQGKYQQAESLYLRSLAISEKVLGKEHPDVASSLNNLAALYQLQGKYQQAEPLYLRALAIVEKVLGNSHPNVASSLSNLAGLYQLQGNYQQAEGLHLRSLAIREKVLGKEHPNVASSLNNLAELYKAQGKYQQAEPLYLRSLAITEKVLGKENSDFANSLNNLAELYRLQGKYQQAEPLNLRSLAIFEKVLGKEHPLVATSLNNLAVVYQLQGKYQQAEPLYQRSLAIRKKVLGNFHPDVAQSWKNLAALYQVQADINRSTDVLRRGLEVQAQNLNLIFAVGSEQRKQNYVKTFSKTIDFTVSLSLQEGRNQKTTASLALTTVLRQKGLVLDAVADSIQILRSQLKKDPETQKLFTQWLQVQQQLSALVFSQPEKQAANLKTQLEQLEAERAKLEAAISTKSAEFRQQTQPVELSTIQSKIPKDAALVEIVQYRPYKAKAKAEAQRFGKPRYAVAVLRSTGEPKLVDLGEAAEIDKLAIDFRVALVKGIRFKKLGRTLDEKLIAPIRPLLGDARHILISPDGQLTLIPFEALKDEQDKFLIQRYAFSYLTTGRDLLRLNSDVNNTSSPVVLADVDYDNQTQTVASAKVSGSRGSQNRRSGDLANLIFDPLAATKDEAVAIKKVLPNAQVLLGKDATETAVKELHSPSILHLATHGFFIADEEQDINASPDFELTPRPKEIIQVENPLLRSGLALAGFNKRSQAKNNNDDGVLTALEVAGLDLRSNQLVVLSACDTGKGDIKVGDGVYGLRRALVIAGSQTQVLSLWQVDDAATKELMVKYYNNLKAGKGRHEALRSAQLDLLNSQEYSEPQFWAAFVPSGNWTPLNNL